MYTRVHYSTVPSSQKVDTDHMPIDQWMDTQNGSIPAMEQYSALEKAEALTEATAWLNLKHMMLSERSQVQKVTKCTMPFP